MTTDAQIEWFSISNEQFMHLITKWVELGPEVRGLYKFEQDGKHNVAYGEENEGEFGLLSTFDPATNETTYFATLTALALAEDVNDGNVI